MSSFFVNDRKRVRTSYSPKSNSEHDRKKINREEDNKKREVGQKSPIREIYTRRSAERRNVPREEIKYKKYRGRDISPIKNSLPHYHSPPRKEKSPSKEHFNERVIPKRSVREERSRKSHQSKREMSPDCRSSREEVTLGKEQLKKPSFNENSFSSEINCKTYQDLPTSSKDSIGRSPNEREPSLLWEPFSKHNINKSDHLTKVGKMKYEDVTLGKCSSPNTEICWDRCIMSIDFSDPEDVSSKYTTANSIIDVSKINREAQEKDLHTTRRDCLSENKCILKYPEGKSNDKYLVGDQMLIESPQIKENEKNSSLQCGVAEKSSIYEEIHKTYGDNHNIGRPLIKNVNNSNNVLTDIVSVGEEIIESRVGYKVPEQTCINHNNDAIFSEREVEITLANNSCIETRIKVEKTASVTDSGSVDDGSQCNEINENDVTGNVEEEIGEESRLIQLNPALREFDILDDLEEEDDETQLSNSSEYESDVSEELPLEDVDAMLEEGLPDKFKASGKSKEHTIKLKRKVVLEEKGYDHFDLLPEGWIQIMHSSGMPVYLHQKTRVCTMARPYYLGPGSSRNHKVPLSAVPCLQYRRALDLEKKNQEEKEKNIEQNKNQSEIQSMAAKIETSEENEAAQSLEALDLREYCKQIFNFRTITLIPFKSWADRRKYVRMTKDLKKRQRPSLPSGTKLLKFPIQNPDGTNSRSKREWIINPNGKSYVCILHEYVQHALRKHPKYQFKELENPATPYSATVFIGDLQYSVGMGASKKQAKVEAAKAALEVLIPEMKDKIERDSQFGMRSGIARRSQNNDVSIFDQIKVEDPRVAEFCAKTTEPPPYAILLTCLSRNMGLGDIKVHYEMNSKKHKEDEFTMSVGNHTATVVCKNKRDGKQRAAQAILQALHPNITHWGSLLRMYGNRSIKNVKEKKQEEQEITGLQSKASLNQPNFAILEKLRIEMLKLKDKRDAIKAKGKFTPPENIILPSLSSTDLNKVNFS